MTVRATTLDVLTRTRDALRAEAQAAAGNALLSQLEQNGLAPGLLLDAAVAVRTQGGSGARVEVDALAVEASRQLEALLGAVNTSGPSAVSQAEVRALHGANADAGTRVARAYELITGRHIDLPTSGVPTPPPVTPPVTPPPVTPPVTPPPPGPGVGTRVAITSFSQNPTPALPYAGPTTLLPDGALQIERGAAVPSTFTLDVNGQTFTATIDGSERMSGRIANVATPADVIEALRKALAPSYHLRLRSHTNGGSVVEVFAGVAPPPASPTYLYAEMRDANGVKQYNGLELRGPLRFVANHGVTLNAGDTLTLRIDDQVFTASATRAGQSIRGLIRSLRDQAVAAGRTIDLREYTNYAPWTFIVTG